MGLTNAINLVMLKATSPARVILSHRGGDEEETVADQLRAVFADKKKGARLVTQLKCWDADGLVSRKEFRLAIFKGLKITAPAKELNAFFDKEILGGAKCGGEATFAQLQASLLRLQGGDTPPATPQAEHDKAAAAAPSKRRVRLASTPPRIAPNPAAPPRVHAFLEEVAAQKNLPATAPPSISPAMTRAVTMTAVSALSAASPSPAMMRAGMLAPLSPAAIGGGGGMMKFAPLSMPSPSLRPGGQLSSKSGLMLGRWAQIAMQEAR